MASTRTVAIAVGSTAAAVTFAVVSILGSATPRPDLGGPVVVEVDRVEPPDLGGPVVDRSGGAN